MFEKSLNITQIPSIIKTIGIAIVVFPNSPPNIPYFKKFPTPPKSLLYIITAEIIPTIKHTANARACCSSAQP